MRQRNDSADTVASVKCELAGEVLRSFGSLRFTATGWSMLPAIWSGDTLVVERVRPEQLRVGNIVLIGRDGRLCAHRLISTPLDSGNSHWIVQGDALRAPDKPVREDELLGRVEYVIRDGRLVPIAEPVALQKLTAQIIRRSPSATRVLIYLHSATRSRKEITTPCLG
jgi:signal peptidase